MKYLLKQRLSYKREQTLFHVFPNEYSSNFIRLANKQELILQVNKKWDGKYSTVESYDILENDFYRLKRQYVRKIEEKREKFYRKGLLVQLILILKYIFNRNIRAKEVQKYSARLNAYDDKTEFLKLALDIAEKVKNEAFSYGYQTDPANSYHHYIYYFQLDNKQVSFHSERLFSDCPKFEGKWIGYRNETFPFKNPKGKVKKLHLKLVG